MYPTVLDYAISELCYLCLENPEISIRDILCAYYLGLEAISLILRGILCKLKYPGAEDYSSLSMKANTFELYTIICEYLDISLISKRPKQETKEKVPQLYFFSDHDLFVVTPDNKEFVCGIYF